MTKLVVTADLHGHLPGDVPHGDVLVIAGDICPWDRSHAYWAQYKWMTGKFFPWLKSIDTVDDIIFIGGNHDFVLDPVMRTLFHTPDGRHTNPAYRKMMEAVNELPGHIHYLKDSGIELNGVKFWGTPHTPTFGGWAFMDADNMLHEIFENIPEDTDVLISHGPPYGFGDIALDIGGKSHVGSYALASTLSKRPNVKLNFFGHIHGGYGNHCDDEHGISHHMWENPIAALMCNVACRDDFYTLRSSTFNVIDMIEVEEV